MTHVAMTDHGNMYGADEFHRQAKERRHQPGHRHRGLRRPRHRRTSNRSCGASRTRSGTTSPPPAPTCTRRSGRATPRACTTCSSSPPAPSPRACCEVGPDGPGDHRRARRRADGHHRLPVRRSADPAAARPVGRGAQVRRRVPGHLRQGELLPRADGPRPRHRDPGARRPDRDRQEAEHPAGRHQRLALQQGKRLRVARPAAVHPDRQDPGRRRPLQVRRLRLLHQVARRDVRDQQQRHLAGGLPQLPAADRRPGRHDRHVRVRQPDAAVPDPGGFRFRGRAVRPHRLGGHGQALPGRHRRHPPQAGRVRDRHHRPDGLPGLLPGRRGLHQLGEEQRRRGRPGPRLARRAASSPTRWASPTSTPWTTA